MIYFASSRLSQCKGITRFTFSLDFCSHMCLTSGLFRSRGCVIDAFCPQSPARRGEWDRCWVGSCCEETVLGPASLQISGLPHSPCFFHTDLIWVLKHTWLVSASALAFLPSEAPLRSFCDWLLSIFYRSQLKLTFSDMLFLTAYIK